MDWLDTILPISVALALSPLPIIAVVLIAGSPRGRVAAPVYLLGWLIGLAALAIASTLILHLIGDLGPTGALILDGLRVLLGMLLLWAALRKWQGRPQAGEEPIVPAWLAAFRRVSPLAALRLGVLVAALNPKHLGLVLAAMASLAYAPLLGGELILGIIVLMLLGSGVIIAVVVGHAVAGTAAAPLLEAVEQFMLRNNNLIVMIVLALIGVTVLGQGIAGLLGGV